MGQLNICDKLEGFFQLSGHFLAKNQGRRQVCKSGGAGMLLSADILPQNTMYSNIRYDEPQKLGGLQPPSPPLVYTLVYNS